MENRPKAFIEKTEWKKVRNDVLKVNPELAKIIDELSPGAKYPLYKAVYPFGSLILKDGYLTIPDKNGALLPFQHPDVKPEIKENLGYNLGSNPVTLVLKNTLELFVKIEDRIISYYGLIQPGKLFGLWRILNSSSKNNSYHPTFTWEMTAGGRLLMLPKITLTSAHRKLQQALHIQSDVPHGLSGQSNVFCEIANQVDKENPWCVETLFFSESWFQSLDDSKWSKFNNYLFRTAWDGSDFPRNEYIWNMVFSSIQEKRNIKSDPYFINTIKLLFAIATGAVPGFAPTIDDSAGPVSKIQMAYRDIYGIQYAPIIMQSVNFSLGRGSRPVYYSLEYPSLIEFVKRSKVLSNKITDLIHIQHILNKFISEILHGNLNLENTPFYDLAKMVDYDFFHSIAENYHGIKSSKNLPIEDPAFLEMLKNFKNRSFPDNSSFVRGCIRISQKA